MPSSDEPLRASRTTGGSPATVRIGRPPREQPTFPAEAESLLRHLNLGPTSPAPPDELPDVPGFEVECELGRGGMGVVYKARHLGMNRTVGLKMILSSARASAAEVARFLAEAEAVAAIEHPNVVKVYDLGGDCAGRPYFVMEFVGGGSLAALLRAEKQLAPRVAAELIAGVADGVQAAHEQGIVHRDLKPGNILLAKDEGRRMGDEMRKEGGVDSTSSFIPHPSSLHPKVSDFGLAKRRASDLTRTQAVMGTPAYMAPEQADGKAKFVGPQADVYALGAILYECLTGRPPFDAPDTWSLIRQVLADAPEPPRKFAPGVSRDLELICLKCLAKEPRDRYSTAADLADDLRRFLRGKPVSVRPISFSRRVVRLVRRNPAPAALAGLVALLMLVVPPLAVWQQGRLERRDAVAGEARQKEEAARQAQGAAERLADARELFAIQTKLRNWSADRPPGWARKTRDELPRAVRLADEPEEVGDLRSLAASALLADDLTPLDSVPLVESASALATDPRTGLVAAGEHKSWAACSVHLIDPYTGRKVRTLSFPTAAVRIGAGPLDVAQDGTRALAFSPDGKHLFVGTRSSKVVRFDLDSPKNTPALAWNACSHAVDQLAVSPDGKAVYGVCRPEPRVFAWSADAGKPLPPFAPPEPGPVKGFAVLPSGELVACNGQKLYRWSPGGKLLHSEPHDGASRLAATCGSMLLVGSGAYLDTADRETLAPTDRFLDPTVRRGAHEESLKSITLHPSGGFAATTAADSDRAVKVWALGSGRLIGTARASGTGPVGVTWSLDGSYLLVSSHLKVDRWRFEWAEAQRYACPSAFAIEAAAFLHDGRVAVLGEYFNGRRELVLQQVGSRAEPLSLSDRGGGSRPGLSSEPGGTLALTRSAAGLTRWKPGQPAPGLEDTKQRAWYPRFGRDGSTLWAVVNAREVRAYDEAAGEERGKWDNSLEEYVSGLATLESLAAGRELAAAGGRGGAVYVLDSHAKLVGKYERSGDPVLSVAVAPDDSLVVAGTQQGLVRVIDLAVKAELSPGPAHPGGTAAVAISRDGALLATGGADRAVRLWRRAGCHFEPLLTVSNLPCAVRELQFSPADGRLLVLLANSHAVRVWDIDLLKKQLAELKLGW